jgi:hypothetical protein
MRKGQHETALWARELRGSLDDVAAQSADAFERPKTRTSWRVDERARWCDPPLQLAPECECDQFSEHVDLIPNLATRRKIVECES